jgi:hypothetical protein
MPTKMRNLESIFDMLADISNISLLPVADDHTGDNTADMFANHFRSLEYNVIALGYYGKDFLSNNDAFDESFYRQAGLQFDTRWSNFHYERNHDREQFLFNTLCGVGNEGKYIFIHEDPSRDQIIDRSICNKNLKEVLPGINGPHCMNSIDNGRFFDYGYILENAAEIHCVESAFAILTDHLNLSKTKRFIHRYTRGFIANDPKFGPTYRNSHIIIDKTKEGITE